MILAISFIGFCVGIYNSPTFRPDMGRTAVIVSAVLTAASLLGIVFGTISLATP